MHTEKWGTQRRTPGRWLARNRSTRFWKSGDNAGAPSTFALFNQTTSPATSDDPLGGDVPIARPQGLVTSRGGLGSANLVIPAKEMNGWPAVPTSDSVSNDQSLNLTKKGNSSSNDAFVTRRVMTSIMATNNAGERPAHWMGREEEVRRHSAVSGAQSAAQSDCRSSRMFPRSQAIQSSLEQRAGGLYFLPFPQEFLQPCQRRRESLARRFAHFALLTAGPTDRRHKR